MRYSRIRSSSLALVVIAASVLALVVTACGGGGNEGGATTDASPEEEVRAAVEGFTVALGSKDYERICDLLTTDYRESFSTKIGSTQVECEDLRGSWKNSTFQGLTVAAISVDGEQATVTFENSPVVAELELENGHWRVSSI